MTNPSHPIAKFFLNSFIAVSLILIFTPVLHAEIKFNSAYLTETSTCKTKSGQNPKGSPVIFIKHWHLSPGINTKAEPAKEPIAQLQNMTSIQLQILDWASKKQINEVWVEGCEYPQELNSNFTTAYNGWTLPEVLKLKDASEFSSIATHVGLKIEAQNGDQIKTVCSDQIALIEAGQKALSDARADLGYLSRLQQYQNDPARAKTYLEGAIESYSLPKKSTIKQVIAHLKKSLKKDMQQFRFNLDQRSRKLVQNLAQNIKMQIAAQSSPQPIVVVWGGLHAKEFVSAMNQQKLSCTVYTPSGYQPADEKIIEDFQKSL
jgi:hypothetical protein